MKNLQTVLTGSITTLAELKNSDPKAAAKVEARLDSSFFEYQKGDQLHLIDSAKEAYGFKTKINGKEVIMWGLPCVHVRGTERSKYFFSVGTLTRRSIDKIMTSETEGYNTIDEHKDFYGKSINQLAKSLSGKVVEVVNHKDIVVYTEFAENAEGVNKAIESSKKKRTTPVFKMAGNAVISADERAELLK